MNKCLNCGKIISRNSEVCSQKCASEILLEMNKFKLHWDVEDEIVDAVDEKDAKEQAFYKVLYKEIKIKLTVEKI